MTKLSAALLVPILSLATTTCLDAQQGIGRPFNWLNNNTSHLLDVTAALTPVLGYPVTNHYGTVCVPNGHVFVSVRQSAVGTPHYICEFDATGNFVAAYPTPSTIPDGFGIRDLTWDWKFDSTSRIYGGISNDRTAYSFDWQTGQWTPADDVAMPALLAGTIRGITVADYGGTPVFVLADGTGPVEYFRVADGLQFQAPTPTRGNARSVAFSPATDTIWFGEGSHGDFYETDMQGVATGRELDLGQGVHIRGMQIHQDWTSGEWIFTYSHAHGGATNDEVGKIYSLFNFGTGCNGEIGYSGKIQTGNANFAVTISGAQNATQALPWMGIPAQVPTGYPLPWVANCNMFLDIPTVAIALPVTVPLTNGAGSFNLPIPADPGLTGAVIAFQWIVPTPSILPVDFSDAGTIYIQ